MAIDGTRQEIEAIISTVPDAQKQAALRTSLNDLVSQHATADAPTQQSIEVQLAALREEAQAAAATPATPPAPPAPPAPPSPPSPPADSSGGGFLSKAGFALVLILTLLSFAFLFFFVERIVKRELSAIESVQFLIVLTLILSMLAFGGLLMIRALFAPYERQELENRFRMGREVFLVFSGVFGTIIGFYFGSDDDDTGGGAPTVEVAFEGGRVTAAIAGGNGPFTAIYTAPGETGGRVMAAEERVHSIEVGGTCPDGADIVVIDGRGRRAEAQLECEGGGEGEDNAADLPPTPANNTTATTTPPNAT